MPHFNIQRDNNDAGLWIIHAVSIKLPAVIFCAVEQIPKHAGLYAKRCC